MRGTVFFAERFVVEDWGKCEKRQCLWYGKCEKRVLLWWGKCEKLWLFYLLIE